MLTAYETPTFVAESAKIWSTEERLQFFAWIATEPEAGVVIPDSGGCRKVCWARQGTGEHGGARVIYFIHLAGVGGREPRTTFPLTSFARFGRRSKMTARTSKTSRTQGEELGLKRLQSVRDLKALNFARSTRIQVNEVVEARQSTGLSQAEFASALSISRRTLQEWEQGRRAPSGAAQALIRIARKHPEVVKEALR